MLWMPLPCCAQVPAVGPLGTGRQDSIFKALASTHPITPQVLPANDRVTAKRSLKTNRTHRGLEEAVSLPSDKTERWVDLGQTGWHSPLGSLGYKGIEGRLGLQLKRAVVKGGTGEPRCGVWEREWEPQEEDLLAGLTLVGAQEEAVSCDAGRARH